MRRLTLLLAIVLGGTLVLPAAQAATRARKMTIEVLSLTRVTIPHDRPPKGKENKGDWLEYKDSLLTTGPLFGKTKKNQPIGWDAGTQTFTSPTTIRLRGEATFPGQGTIRFRGALKSLPNGSSSVPVIGGTGRFTGARGLLVLGKPFGPNEIESINTYRIRLPGGPVA